MGLPVEAQNLVILTYVAQTNRACFRQTVPYQAGITNLPDECELREQQLPDVPVWEAALERAETIFGVSVSPLRSAANAAQLAAEVQRTASEARPGCEQYTRLLREKLPVHGSGVTGAPRELTAFAVSGLVGRLQSAKPEAVVGMLTEVQVPTTTEAMGVCRRDAGRLAEVLQTANWGLFELLATLPQPHQAEAQAILQELAESLRADELALPLAPALAATQAQALRLIGKAAQAPAAEAGRDGPAAPVIEPPAPGARVLSRRSRADLSLREAREELARLERDQQTGTRVRVSLSWIVETDESGA
jgi:hypothetical protein